MKFKFLAIVLLFASTSVSAQNLSDQLYRGFLDAGCSIGFNDYQFERFEINTSHGFQMDTHLFFGAGCGIHYSPQYMTYRQYTNDSREAEFDVPIYANARINILKSYNTPFIDARIGQIVNNDCGTYMSFSIGYRTHSDEKSALNLSLGYTSAELSFNTSYFFSSSNHLVNQKTESVTLRIGYEF